MLLLSKMDHDLDWSSILVEVINMSVLVKDWNLPDMCLVCPFFSGQGCKVTMRLFPDWVNVATRPAGCPLSEYYKPPTYVVDDLVPPCC